jgi:hypothetical protein
MGIVDLQFHLISNTFLFVIIFQFHIVINDLQHLRYFVKIFIFFKGIQTTLKAKLRVIHSPPNPHYILQLYVHSLTIHYLLFLQESLRLVVKLLYLYPYRVNFSLVISDSSLVLFPYLISIISPNV